MTGYGKATAELPDKKINVEIKSLNSKAMDLSTRIAPAYREKEIEIRNEISKVLERGKVDFSLWIEKKEAAENATPINQVLVEGYYKQILAISQNLGIPVPADWFQTLLRMPDVMTKTEIQELTEEEWKMVHATVLDAISHLVDFRKQEGAALEKKFREKIANISSLLEKIAPYEKERVEKVKERITDALEKTLSVDYDKNRLEQELIYYIEKLDVNEEKQRLSNHLKYFISTMESGNGQGKKLGFIAQEMGREINTLGSKSNHAEMQKIVVQMKDELEQIKEHAGPGLRPDAPDGSGPCAGRRSGPAFSSRVPGRRRRRCCPFCPGGCRGQIACGPPPPRGCNPFPKARRRMRRAGPSGAEGEASAGARPCLRAGRSPKAGARRWSPGLALRTGRNR